ncbi:MAG: GNAT family N-acetyltransferase [Niameybacter sp.]|uniref:GNAT family N-acetyltransferase n=1 Tax=Niameybacter sp. TaxID=2033640 RepID=UPI002FC784C7
MTWEIKHFNDLTPKALYDLIKLRLEVFIGEQGCSYEDLDDRDKQAYHVFLYDADKVVAYCRILDEGVAYEEHSIGRVCVHSNYRNQGLAREMMKYAMQFVKNQDCTHQIKISAQSYIIPFYESLGFESISEPYLEEGIEHRKMKWK